MCVKILKSQNSTIPKKTVQIFKVDLKRSSAYLEILLVQEPIFSNKICYYLVKHSRILEELNPHTKMVN